MAKKSTSKTEVTAAPGTAGLKKLKLGALLPEGMTRESLPPPLQIPELKWALSLEELQDQADVVCKPNQSDMLQPDRLLRWVQHVAKYPQVTQAMLVPTQAAPSAKEGVWSRISFAFQGYAERLFSGIEAHHAALSLTFFPIAALQSCWNNNKGYLSASHLALCRELYAEGTPLHALPLQGFQEKRPPFLLALFTGKLQAFRLIWEEFVQIPLRNGLSVKQIWGNNNAPLYRFKFFVMALIALLSMLFMSQSFNVTWDEETNQESAELTYRYLTTLGNDTTMFNFAEGRNRYTNQHYGMSFDVMAVAVQKLVWKVNPAANLYAIRHFLNAIIGFFVLLFTALLARKMMDWRTAIMALFLVYFSPSFFGHAFNNPKDIPFALGFIMGIYYLVRVLKEWPQPRLQSRVLLAVGLGYCLSIRAGGLLLFAIVGLFVGVHWLLSIKKSPSLKPYLRYGLPVLILGYFLGIMFWPFALRAPLAGPLKALKEFENFSHLAYYELFEGVRLYIKPWHYIPKLIAITAPLTFLLGLPLVALFFVGKKRNSLQWMLLALLLFAGLFPPAYTIYKGSYLYNGWRHMLFVYPPLLVLAAMGWSRLQDLFASKAIKGVFMGLFLATAMPATVWSLANHPYQYMYFNETVGGIKGANGNYELDYWNQTPRAAMEWIAQNRPDWFNGDILVNSNNPVETLKTFVPGSDSMKYRWTREYEWTQHEWDAAIWTHRTLNKQQIRGGYWPPVGTVHTVNVGGVPVCAVVERPSLDGYNAHQQLRANNAEQAKLLYLNAIEKEPLEEEYHRGLGAAYRALGSFDEAIASYSKAATLRDGNYDALSSLGEIYFTRYYMQQSSGSPNPSDLDVAKKYLEASIQHKHNNLNAYNYLGMIAMTQNDMVLAMQSYKTMLEQNNSLPQAYQGIARVFLNLNQSDSALFYLNYAMQLAPNAPEVYSDISRAFQQKGDMQNAMKYRDEFIKRQQGGAN